MAEPARIPKDVQQRIKDGAIGDYKIVSAIGAGGMGAVLRCRDKKLRREVAVKLLLNCGDDRSVQRFLEEARTLAKLSHPNVVHVYDVDYDGHVPFFVMELIEGESVAQLLDRLSRLSIEDTRRILAQTARGLAAVHALGIIHRDVKAANVIVRPDGGVKLLDFGIARPVENAPPLTSSGLVMGTPSSMSPEQLRGEELDPRADVYALGVLLYQMLTGQRPYEGNDPQELAQEQDARPPRPVRELRTDTPDDLARVVAKALAKEREHRYWNCDELLKDLAEEPAAGAPRTTVPDIARESRAAGPRRVRQHWTAIAVAAVLIAGAWVAIARWIVSGCLVCEAPVPRAEGRPAMEGGSDGVYVWHDGAGWHVEARSVTAKTPLWLDVRVSGGVVLGTSPLDDASADALTLVGRREVRFAIDDAAAGAGFGFHVERHACVELDGPPNAVFVGAAAEQVEPPLRICPE